MQTFTRQGYQFGPFTFSDSFTGVTKLKSTELSNRDKFMQTILPQKVTKICFDAFLNATPAQAAKPALNTGTGTPFTYRVYGQRKRPDDSGWENVYVHDSSSDWIYGSIDLTECVKLGSYVNMDRQDFYDKLRQVISEVVNEMDFTDYEKLKWSTQWSEFGNKVENSCYWSSDPIQTSIILESLQRIARPYIMKHLEDMTGSNEVIMFESNIISPLTKSISKGYSGLGLPHLQPIIKFQSKDFENGRGDVDEVYGSTRLNWKFFPYDQIRKPKVIGVVLYDQDSWPLFYGEYGIWIQNKNDASKNQQDSDYTKKAIGSFLKYLFIGLTVSIPQVSSTPGKLDSGGNGSTQGTLPQSTSQFDSTEGVRSDAEFGPFFGTLKRTGEGYSLFNNKGEFVTSASTINGVNTYLSQKGLTMRPNDGNLQMNWKRGNEYIRGNQELVNVTRMK